MNEKFNKNEKVEHLTKVVLSHGEEKGHIVKDPYLMLTFCSNSYIDVMSVALSISISYKSYYVSVHKSYYKCLKSVNIH